MGFIGSDDLMYFSFIKYFKCIYELILEVVYYGGAIKESTGNQSGTTHHLNSLSKGLVRTNAFE